MIQWLLTESYFLSERFGADLHAADDFKYLIIWCEFCHNSSVRKNVSNRKKHAAAIHFIVVGMSGHIFIIEMRAWMSRSFDNNEPK